MIRLNIVHNDHFQNQLMIVAKCNGLFYKLNKKNYTASIIFSPDANGNVHIPRSINFNSDEYIISSIESESFKSNSNINSITFLEGSELRSIQKNAFICSSLQSIFLPPKLNELQEGWCKGSSYLTNVKIHKNNQHFKYLDEKCQIIAGKSNPKSDIFDVLVFASRDIVHFTIPSTIKYIGSFSFYECWNLHTINFSENSQLFSIGKNSFSYSSIESLFVPSNVSILDESWLGDVSALNNIVISPNNKHLSYLDDEHQIIVGKSKMNNKNFDVIIFASHEIESVFIPSSIKYINSYSFSYCRNLKTIQFEKNSQLISIGKNAFSNSSIVEIFFPSSVELIEKRAFLFCDSLKSISFDNDSKLQTLDSFLIYGSPVVNLTIPSNVIDIKDDCLMDASELKNVFISPNNKNFCYLDESCKIIVKKSYCDCFDVILFSCRDVERVFIPSSIKQINLFAFSHCVNMKTFQIEKDSNLISIGKFAFSNSSIDMISIPKSVTLISEKLFLCCKKLKKVIFSMNSIFLNIEKSAFEYSMIENIAIYSKECIVGEKSFANCVSFKSFEFLGEILSIDNNCFLNDDNFLIISFPNAREISITESSFRLVSNDFSIFVCFNANINRKSNLK